MYWFCSRRSRILPAFSDRLLDENIPPATANYLSRKRPDWTVRHVRDIGLRGASDKVIFDWAQKNNFIVITFDEDFADARMFPAGTHNGVIRLRVWPTTVEAVEATRSAVE